MKRFFLDEQGTAMTEGAIVLPFFILILMGLVALHHLCEGRLQAQVDSEANALFLSIEGCNGQHAVDLTKEAGQSATMDQQTSDWVTDLTGDQPFSWSHTDGQAVVTVDDVPKTFGGPTSKVKATQRFMCNMEPKQGLTDLIVGLVRDLLGI